MLVPRGPLAGLVAAALAFTAACSAAPGAAGPGTGGSASTGSGGTTASEPLGYFDGKSRLTDLTETSCEVTVTSADIAEDMATVGIVTFTTTLPGLRAAEIHFGPDTEYGLVAPVDLSEEGYRTLLLGMIQNATYHFRVAVSDGSSVCYGHDQTLDTGTLAAIDGDVVVLTEISTSPAAAPGFMVTSRDGDALIYDKNGEVVWAHAMDYVFSVHMSWDGKYMIGRDGGPFDQGDGGMFYRLMMDGSGSLAVDAPGGDHHDFASIPSGIAYLAKPDAGACDHVYEASIDLTDGASVLDTWPIFEHFTDEGMAEGSEICHANRIHYSLEQDSYTVSDRNKDVIGVWGRSGTPLLSIGKTPIGDLPTHVLAEGAGPGGAWHVQHGHHFYADDALVVFSNEADGGSAALHYTITGNSARLDWKYSGAGDSMIQGDVQHLPNGNFLVTSNLGSSIVELGPDGQTEVGRYVLGGPRGPSYGFGYVDHRPSLYGAPPPR